VTPRAAIRRLAVLAAALVVAISSLVATHAATASADYYWGCTYTYPNSCLQPGSPGVINRLETMDNQEALTIEPKARAPFNGYKKPEERGTLALQTCGTIYEGGVTVPWSCSMAANQYYFPEWHWGHGMMGSEIAYSKVSYWQDVNIGE
jgi:hypothetical protein